jgi:hypothetical protein
MAPVSGREYHLWVATDGEVRAATEIPEPRIRGMTRWLPSGERFTEEEARDAMTLICNLSRYDNKTMYLNGASIIGGPWPTSRTMELLDRFEMDVKRAVQRRDG